MAEAHERKIKRILAREWKQIRDGWLDCVPTISRAGQAPAHQLSELTSLEGQLTKISDSQVEEVDEISGLRSGMLHDAIFLLHKASHVLGACLVHVDKGMCTWSISSAYQSAFFAMKSIMAFLGVCVVESGNRHFLIDVWGTSHERKRRNKGPFIILANTRRNEQRNYWAYFQRSVEQTLDRDDIWNADVTGQLLNWDYKDFGRQRNKLHYHTNWWPLDDLHGCVNAPEFGKWRSLDCVDSDDDPDFPLLLAFALVRMAGDLLTDLAQESVLIERELSLLQSRLSQPFAELYQKSQLDQAS